MVGSSWYQRAAKASRALMFTAFQQPLRRQGWDRARPHLGFKCPEEDPKAERAPHKITFVGNEPTLRNALPCV